MTQPDWKQRSNDLLVKNLALPQALMVRGKGCYLWDDSGKKYLDFLGGIAVNCLGHGHPQVVEALAHQSRTLDHISNYFVSQAQLDLAERLLQLAGANNGRVFFSNSGTEANEAALKMSRLWGNPRGKHRVLAFDGAFHGRSMGALSLTSKEQYRLPFAPLPGGVEHLELSVAAAEEAFDDKVAAVFVEPIQGEAGVKELPQGLLRRLRELCDEHESLLIFDEVQTGVGRSGEWFAYQLEGVNPDAVTLAKGLGGGFPIGSLITFERAADLFYPGSHGTTFGGNPVASHVALTVLDLIDSEGILENVKERSLQIRQGVRGLGLPEVDSVRGAGLLLGVQLSAPVAVAVAQKAFESGLIINAAAPDVIRLVPPLVVTEEEVNEFLRLFRAALESHQA